MFHQQMQSLDIQLTLFVAVVNFPSQNSNQKSNAIGLKCLPNITVTISNTKSF